MLMMKKKMKSENENNLKSSGRNGGVQNTNIEDKTAMDTARR
jgi:hypothetical protein